MTIASRKLRDLFKQKEIVVAPGVFSPLTAKLAEIKGFRAQYMSGYATAGGQFALPDLGLVTMTEMVQNAWAITSATDLPLVCDADTGYGDVANVSRTVRQLEKVGVAAVHIQDKVWPLRKGGHAMLSTVQEMVDKLHAALDARRDDNLIVIARSDARTFSTLNEAIDRANKYAEAGADMIFVEEPASESEMKRMVAEIPAPQMINLCERGSTPFLTWGALERMGFKLVVYPISALATSVYAVARVFDELLKRGTTVSLWSNMLSVEELDGLMGMEQARALYMRYGFPE